LLRGQRDYRLALETFNEMKQRGLTPTLSSYTLLIQNCPTEQSKKAFELLKEVEESGMPIASEPSLYFHMMRLATSTYEVNI
jgi:pentatricopeptide repeat protein